MKLLRLVSPAVVALVASVAVPASAETVSAQYNGINSTIASWLPLGVFDSAFDSLQSLYDALWIENNSADMDDRAVQQCLGTTLNVAYGQLDWWSLVDLGDDGADDGYFWEFWDDAEAAWDAGDYETAKTICDTINNL